eukprot:1014887-Prymnesium_polylepis.2
MCRRLSPPPFSLSLSLLHTLLSSSSFRVASFRAFGACAGALSSAALVCRPPPRVFGRPFRVLCADAPARASRVSEPPER